ncbi:MAG: ADP-ribose pyrophosphatase [Brockia lithotrophica]|uniref:ADP-ribose pyrophosphatase n=1 Tax=Brockia lithotrophica TaxID=933949 RepID=A0A2T5G649_9BACL|nr:NUDIX hydrolase [Brockia lithotrophica]PTQ51660.1 MAG: ADP-ribose pyrophosphatase [Brockia lithotrophica]
MRETDARARREAHGAENRAAELSEGIERSASEGACPEITLERREMYNGKIVRVVLDQIENCRGHRSTREIVVHPGAVAILARTEEGKFLFVRQYRKPVERDLLEIPAGKREEGEAPEATAVRELREETGYGGGTWTYLGKIYTSPGMLSEGIDLYFSDAVYPVGMQQDDPDEILRVVRLDAEEVRRAVSRGELVDAKSLAALFLASQKLDLGVF